MKQVVSQLKEKWLFLVIWIALVWTSQWITVGLPFGDNLIYFACWSVIAPIVGNFFPMRYSAVFVYLVWTLIQIQTYWPLTLGIPTLFATLSWNVSKDPKSLGSLLIHLVLPLLCMLLFYLSPVGEAWAYSLYWCLPIVLYFLAICRSCSSPMVVRALQSTFVAHAIGSVIWAYFVPMSCQDWIDLIPVVAVERLMMACLGASVCFVLQRIDSVLPKLTVKTLSFRIPRPGRT